MKLTKQSETKIIIIVPVKQSLPPNKPKIEPAVLKAISIAILTLISWLNPEATVATALIKLLFILLEWLNQKKS